MNKKTELIFFGTGNAMVTKCYNTCFAIRCNEEYILVDAGGGNGIFTQLEKAKVPIAGIHEMILTHAHTDHILGMIWIIRKIASMMLAGKYAGNCRIYCHKEAGEALLTICNLTLASKFMKCIGERIQIITVTDGECKELLSFQVQFFDIGSTKMKQYGFMIQIEDKKITCLGDEPFYECERAYAKDSDYLLCEAFCLYADKDVFKPYEKHHSTAADAGRLAQTLGVKNLILYHTEDSALDTRKNTYSKEAMVNFEGRVFVPDDLDRISIT